MYNVVKGLGQRRLIYMLIKGTTEAIGMIESVMEHIAYTVNKDPIVVKLANLEPSEETMPSLVKDMITCSEYEQRKKAVDEFNSVSLFK